MSTSTLHLTIEKGPKQGETLAQSPGGVIRIGRVVRGNTFAIKDPAISQKHLIIQFADGISRWTAEDLDTSNGTFVNDAKIPPLAPFPLSDGDTIKIGEITSISVQISGDGGEVEDGLRRGRRRGARSRAAESLASEVVEEKIERGADDFAEESKNLKRGRPRRGATSRVPRTDENCEKIVEESMVLRPRRATIQTRASSARITKEDDQLMESNAVKTEASGLVVEDSVEAPKNAKRGRPRKGTARTRASSTLTVEVKQKKIELEEVKVDGNVNNGREEVGCEGEEKELRPREGKARTRESSAKATEDEAKKIDEEEMNVEGEVSGERKEIGSEWEDKVKRVKEETVVDFEKMTLGEWFNSMEVYLPRAINEVAEQLIAELREKAQRFDAYLEEISTER